MTRSRLFRSLAFLGYTAAQYLAATALMGAVVLVGYAVTGAPERGYNFFAAYLTGFPGLALVMAIVFGSSLLTLLDQALAFGATRRELFAVIQLVLAGFALLLGGVSALVCLVPGLLGWQIELAMTRALVAGAFPLFALLLFLFGAGGCLFAYLLRRSRPLAGSLAMVAVFLAAGAVLVVLLVAEPMGWGGLPWLLGAAAVALTALAEWALARILRRAVVRG